MSQLHNVINDWIAELSAPVTSTATVLFLASSGGRNAPPVPFYFSVNREIMRCVAMQFDTPSLGIDRLQIDRALDGTVASAHAAGDYAMQKVYAIQWRELQAVIAGGGQAQRLELYDHFFRALTGGGDGVLRHGATDQLQVIPTTPASMNVLIRPGVAMVGGLPSGLLTQATALIAMVGIETVLWHGVVLNQQGQVLVYEGDMAGGLPYIMPDELLLAYIETYMDTTEITTMHIHDRRIYL